MKWTSERLRIPHRYRIEYLFRPGLRLHPAQARVLVDEVRAVAATCFAEIPPYQVMLGTQDELDDKVLALARRPDGVLAGFCSSVLLPVKGLGDVLHLGLTCVRPEDRSAGLTHRLTRRVVATTLLRHHPVGHRLWVSNCAAVLSSLGNVAQHFEGVHPSPREGSRPTLAHLRIADAIDRRYRAKVYIRPDAWFDADAFVFRGSVRGTVFQKDGDDSRFHHRRPALNDYYRGLMDFAAGDEVLQVGYTSPLSPVKHFLRKLRPVRKNQRPAA